MILQVYSVMDTKVGAYLQPFFMRTRGEALRSFEQAVSEETSMFSKAKGDFQLWFLGEWNDNTGVFASHVELVIGADQF